MSSGGEVTSSELGPSEANVPVNIGVLCIQGAFREHIQMLERVAKEKKWSINTVEVRKPSHLKELEGLIIPGGESTTLSVFLSKNSFEETLREWISNETAPGVLWGTCAGLILVANKLTEQKKGGQVTIGGVDIECSRNVYGRQITSFESPITLHSPSLLRDQGSSDKTYHGIFIRAPGISEVNSPEVKVLATLEPEGTVVAVQQRNIIATTFHPELTTDTRWHQFFIQQAMQEKQKRTTRQ